MDIEKVKTLIDDFFSNPPPKNVYESCYLQLLAEKNTLLEDPNCDKEYIDKIDKVCESISAYLEWVRNK